MATEEDLLLKKSTFITITGINTKTNQVPRNPREKTKRMKRCQVKGKGEQPYVLKLAFALPKKSSRTMKVI